MKRKSFLPWLALAGVVAAVFFWWWGHSARRTGDAAGTGPESSGIAGSTGRVDRAVAAGHGRDLFAAAEASLRAGGGAENGRRALAELKAQLAALPREQAVAAIRAQLLAGGDASSGLGFKIGPGGALTEAPSLRVFLLDELARLDPAAAAELARAILGTRTSADEWAVAMRNLARVQSDDSGRAFLEGKMRELLTHEPWQREASEGFLESFDVAVHLRGTNLVPELAALVRKTDNRAASHAAYLALDRLTIADPAPMLARLEDEPDLMVGREVTRANYFARADVSDAAQRAVLERYLIDARRSPEELKTFAGLYPNANFMISQNLLTTVTTPDRAALAARDQTALRVVNEWLADGRFAPLQGHLEPVRARLEKFVRQAEGR